MNKYTFYWKNGRREVLEGNDVIDALMKAGYSAIDLKRLSFYTPGENEDFSWTAETQTWNLHTLITKRKSGKP